MRLRGEPQLEARERDECSSDSSDSVMPSRALLLAAARDGGQAPASPQEADEAQLQKGMRQGPV